MTVSKLRMTALAPTTKRGFVVLGTVTGIDVAGLRTRLGSQTGDNRAKTQHFRQFWMLISRLSIARARARLISGRARARLGRFSARGPKVPTPPAGQAG